MNEDKLAAFLQRRLEETVKDWLAHGVELDAALHALRQVHDQHARADSPKPQQPQQQTQRRAQ